MATLTKDRRAGTWKARVKSVDGTTKTLSIKATNRQAATKILKQSRLIEIEEAAKAGDLQTRGLTAILGHLKVTTAQAVQEFGEWQVTVNRSPLYMHQCKQLLNRFAEAMRVSDTLVPDINERHVYEFINTLNSGNAAWRKSQLGILRAFFEFVSARGYRTGNPAKLVEVRMDQLTHAQKETKPRNPFTDAEIKKLMTVILDEIARLRKRLADLPATEFSKKYVAQKKLADAEFWRAAVPIGRYTGLRIGDICLLEWDTFATPGKLCVWTQKRDKRVMLPLDHPDLVEAIASIKPLSNQYVFPDMRLIYKNLNQRSNIATYFRRWLEAAGIKDKSFHDLRATFASDAAKRGIPIEHIRAMVGHSTTNTTLGYIKAY